MSIESIPLHEEVINEAMKMLKVQAKTKGPGEVGMLAIAQALIILKATGVFTPEEAAEMSMCMALGLFLKMHQREEQAVN